MGTARRTGEQFVRSDAFEGLARAGLVARGAIYGLVGALAIGVATDAGGRTTSQQGAMRTLADAPAGSALLVALAIGLAAYAAWQFVRAAIGHGPESADSTFDRVSDAASGVCYAILFASAIAILAGSGGGSGSPDRATAGVLGWPAGSLIVGAAGLIGIGVGLYQGWRGLGRGFLDDAKTAEMGPSTRRWFTALGVAGHIARMVVFALVGWFLLRAAIDYDPDRAVGLGGALTKLAHASYGPWLLGVVAAGFIAFGAYSVADARFHKV